MQMGARDFFSVLGDVPMLLALKRGMKPRPMTEKDCFGKQVASNAANFPDRPAVIFEGKTTTWDELNREANRYGKMLKDSGIEPGDVVSMMMENRVEFLACVVAINKIGAIAALINTNLRENPLQHCISVTESKMCLFGTELTDAIDGVRNAVDLEGKLVGVTDDSDMVEEKREVPEWAIDLKAASSNLSDAEHAEADDVTLGDTSYYIFTSGTTGLPKAAVMSNRRFLMIAKLSHAAGLRCDENDSIYMCLPLYHATGLVIGVGSAFSSAACLVLRRKFSASRLLGEVRLHNVTHMIYVGELLRYLYNTPEHTDDARNTLHTIMGNGLRPDIWDEFKQRFGIERITEIYGASEGNAAFANILNKDRTIGMTTAKVSLVQYDVANDEIIKDENGHCIPVDDGEAGLCLANINPDAQFEGYTDSEATEKKILRDVFEAGDAWFDTGDLLRTVDVGFALGFDHYQFVDRLGDTFRWRSENVSTNEVGEVLNGFDDVQISNVFGVEIPNAEGRAGMAAVTLVEGKSELNIDAFSTYVNANLPHFARPVFVRVQQQLDVTGTFKMVKGDLSKDGYDITAYDDPVYVMKPRSDQYEPLDAEFVEQINQGEARY